MAEVSNASESATNTAGTAGQESNPMLNPNTNSGDNTNVMSLPPEIAKLVPEKFGGDLNKFIKSYNELEGKLRSRDPVKTETAPVKSELGNIDLKAAYNEFLETGKWNENAIKVLPEEYRQHGEEIRQAQIAKIHEGMANAAQGEDVKAVIEWVKENKGPGKKYSDDELNAAQVLMSKGKFTAFQDLVNDYKASKTAETNGTFKPGNPVATSGGFKDKAEFLKAMSSKEMRLGDPAARASLEAKLKATPEHISKTFG